MGSLRQSALLGFFLAPFLLNGFPVSTLPYPEYPVSRCIFFPARSPQRLKVDGVHFDAYSTANFLLPPSLALS